MRLTKSHHLPPPPSIDKSVYSKPTAYQFATAGVLKAIILHSSHSFHPLNCAIYANNELNNIEKLSEASNTFSILG